MEQAPRSTKRWGLPVVDALNFREQESNPGVFRNLADLESGEVGKGASPADHRLGPVPCMGSQGLGRGPKL